MMCLLNLQRQSCILDNAIMQLKRVSSHTRAQYREIISIKPKLGLDL